MTTRLEKLARGDRTTRFAAFSYRKRGDLRIRSVEKSRRETRKKLERGLDVNGFVSRKKLSEKTVMAWKRASIKKLDSPMAQQRINSAATRDALMVDFLSGILAMEVHQSVFLSSRHTRLSREPTS